MQFPPVALLSAEPMAMRRSRVLGTGIALQELWLLCTEEFPAAFLPSEGDERYLHPLSAARGVQGQKV